MEIYLIRHTSPDIKSGVCYGQSDVFVKKTFEEEARKVVHGLPPGLEKIYTSPLKRCKQLAVYLSLGLNIPFEEDSRLKELDFGDWEMKRWDEIESDLLSVWMNDYVNVECPNGESYHVLSQRVASFLEELIRRGHTRVAVVTHHGVLKCIHAHFNNLTLFKAMGIKFGFGEVLKYSVPSFRTG